MSKAEEQQKKPKTYLDYKLVKTSLVIGTKPNGSPERKYFYGKTKREANAKKAEYARLKDIGVDVSEMTVAQWGQRWLSAYKAEASNTQKAHYRAKLEKDICHPEYGIGHMQVSKVRASHLTELMNCYSGCKHSTVDKIRQAIAQLFDAAELEGIVLHNPARKLKLPPTTEEPRRPLTDDERKIVLQVAKKHTRGTYILTMLYCGTRRAETLALTPADVDLITKRLTISKQFSQQLGPGEITETKSAKLRKNVSQGEDIGSRTVPIPDILVPILNEQCAGKKPNEILFNVNGKYATKQIARGWWKSFARQCHITSGAKVYRNAIDYSTSAFSTNITPHFLRHTYATDLHAAGVDEYTRKVFMGHAHKDVTDGYTGMSDEAFNRAAKQINTYIFEKNGVINGVNEKSD